MEGTFTATPESKTQINETPSVCKLFSFHVKFLYEINFKKTYLPLDGKDMKLQYETQLVY